MRLPMRAVPTVEPNVFLSVQKSGKLTGYRIPGDLARIGSASVGGAQFFLGAAKFEL